MNWLAVVNAMSLALQTIREHKLRAVLTVLGVVMGTGTIIGVGSILTGLDSTIANAIESFGPNTIMVFKFRFGFRSNQLSGEERTRKPLTYQNAMDIQGHCDACQGVSTILLSPGALTGAIIDAKYKGNVIYGVNMSGVGAEYARGGQVDIHLGRFFTEEENRRRAPVVVIGADLEHGLFPDGHPIGKQILVNGQEYEVIGSMNKPPASLFGQPDNRVLVPYWTMQKDYPGAHENFLSVTAKPGLMARAEDQIRVILRIDRRVPYRKEDNFAISTAEQMVSDFRQITSMVALSMVVLSSVGLLVGGIGVMNIMLVSVTERTKEIGIRKAIGARKSDIILQFLLEAVVLTGLGGIAGITFGWLVSLVSRLVFPSLPTTVPLWAAALGLIVSAGTGLFFGIWPAMKAARLDPVEALRYE
ncbi:MAG: ABC transporter permease [Acidobacteriaceae bacterium]|nr:ABC transporter permease [Acidobacteriaceae bacterium]